MKLIILLSLLTFTVSSFAEVTNLIEESVLEHGDKKKGKKRHKH